MSRLPRDSGIESSADLAGKVVAVQLGTSGQELLEDGLKELSDTFSSLTTQSSFNLCSMGGIFLEDQLSDVSRVLQPSHSAIRQVWVFGRCIPFHWMK